MLTILEALYTRNFAGQPKWDSVAGKTYSVYRSSDVGQSFVPLQSNIRATAPLNSLTDLSATGNGPNFYRIQVTY